MKKRFLAIWLCLSLAAGLCAHAQAAESEELLPEESGSLTGLSEEARVVPSGGTCGTGLTWVLNSDGTLWISGSGPMSWTSADAPWSNVSGSIKTLVVKRGVTSIPPHAFRACGALQSVVLPDTVQTIGDSAFAECGALSNLFLQEGLLGIGKYAFSECTALSSVSIPSTVQTLDVGAFGACTGLRSAAVQDGNRKISQNCFNGCTNLNYFFLSASVVEIGPLAFYGCDYLRRITYCGSQEDWQRLTGFVTDANRNFLLGSPEKRISSQPLPQPNSGLTFDWTDLTLALGATQYLPATKSVPVTSWTQSIVYVSSDPSVASVSNTGYVNARSRGTAEVMAFCGAGSASCTVTVAEAPSVNALLTDEGGTPLSSAREAAGKTALLSVQLNNDG